MTVKIPQWHRAGRHRPVGLAGRLVVVLHQLVKEVPAQRLHDDGRDAELAIADGDRLAVGHGGHGIAGAAARPLDHAVVGETIIVRDQSASANQVFSSHHLYNEGRLGDGALIRNEGMLPTVLAKAAAAPVCNVEGAGNSIASTHPATANENALRPPRFALYIASSAALSREAAPSPSVG